jgi:hypothetical protein
LLRGNRAGAAETFQALPALLITIVLVGLVFGALAAANEGARARESQERAQLQAHLFLVALPDERALRAPGGAVAWEGALALAQARASLAFVPPRACIASLLDTDSGTELFLLGSLDTLTAACETTASPVPILRGNGSVVPGILRAGVLPS